MDSGTTAVGFLKRKAVSIKLGNEEAMQRDGLQANVFNQSKVYGQYSDNSHKQGSSKEKTVEMNVSSRVCLH